MLDIPTQHVGHWRQSEGGQRRPALSGAVGAVLPDRADQQRGHGRPLARHGREPADLRNSLPPRNQPVRLHHPQAILRGCEILSHIHNHEYVIGYLGHGKIDGTHYLAMEYVEGSNLKLLMAQSDPALEEIAGNLLIDAAMALEHVHESGYMHLDFKPENLVITRNGNVRLVDFDLARKRPEFAEKLSANPGTPAYMSPEQLLREPVDHRADIFAFGVTAYEFLTFRKPFPGENPDEILSRELDRSIDFLAPREVNPDLPLALERIVLKCLEREPEKRYPFMSVVVRDLQSVLYV